MKCVERKVRLSGEEVSYDCELLAFEERYAVLEYRIEQARRVDELLLPAGTITLALYYLERPFNLYYWIAPARNGRRRESTTAPQASGPTAADVPSASSPWEREIACYFNIAQTLLLSREEIVYRDLVVDLLVLPDGRTKVLDESELPADLDSSLSNRIYTARDGLLANYRQVIEEARQILAPFVETR